MKRIGLLFAALGIAAPAAAAAETFHVYPDGSGDYPTILAAMWASSDGDTVLLADGVYTGDGNRDLANLSRWILIRSVSGDPAQCVIDCEGSSVDPHYGIRLDITGSKAPPVRTPFGLDGITIANAWSHSGAAVHISDGAVPTIRNCRFLDNTAVHEGGVVASSESGGVFENCTFAGNRAPTGGAMALGPYFYLEAVDCTFVGNEADVGGAVDVRMSSYHVVMTRCTFSDNGATVAAHANLRDGSALTLERCILSFGDAGEAVVCEPGSSVSLTCCDVFGNAGGDWIGCIADQYGANGNIALDPLFCDPQLLDYSLASTSPCAPFTPPNPACDRIGAHSVACGPVSVARESWGKVKERYR